jgi:hypothetical protein
MLLNIGENGEAVFSYANHKPVCMAIPNSRGRELAIAMAVKRKHPVDDVIRSLI